MSKLENPLGGKYTIDLSDKGKVLVKRNYDDLDDIEFSVPSNYSITQPYVIRFSKTGKEEGSAGGKYIMYTDLNGALSEVLVGPDELNKDDKIRDIELDTDYLFFVFMVAETEEEAKNAVQNPVYIKLSPGTSDNPQKLNI